MTGGRRAVFLDRDGVLNETVMRDGKPASPRTAAEFTLAPDVAAVQRLKDAGLLVFVITNQPDVARGRVAASELDDMMALVRAYVPVDDVRMCLHDDADACACRKPRPGMILDLAHHWHVDLERSVVIGDMWRDVEAARAAGCRSILISRDYNRDARADAEAETLTRAVELVLDDAT